MSLAATSYVLGRQWGGQLRKLLMLVLADFADEAGACWASIDTLAYRAECSRRAVQDNLGELVDDGALEIDPNAGPRGCNIYRLNFKNSPDSGELFPPPAEGGAAAAPPRAANSMGGAANSMGGAANSMGGAANSMGGADERRPSAPLNDQNKEGEPPPISPPSSPAPYPMDARLLAEVARLFPRAPAAYSRAEARAARHAAPILAEWSDADWLAARAWLAAPNRIRGRPLWPRDRGEFITGASELTEKLRLWWPAGGSEWWRRRDKKPTPTPADAGQEEPPATKEEALAVLRSLRRSMQAKPSAP